MPLPRYWAEMTWTDFRDADMEEVIAILPVAAIEQHGPHLPTGVDAMIMEGYMRRVLARAPPALPILALPMQSVGASSEHADFPGTLSLSVETAARAWVEIGDGVARAGCRKLVIINSHGGNGPVIDGVARTLRQRHGMLVVVASWSRFGYPDGLFGPAERLHGIHAGDIETSLMLAFEPQLVRGGELRDFEPTSVAMERDFTWLRAGRPAGFGWMAQDLSASGAMGNATAATCEKGEACADYGATAFVELLQDVEAFDLERLAKGPLG